MGHLSSWLIPLATLRPFDSVTDPFLGFISVRWNEWRFSSPRSSSSCSMNSVVAPAFVDSENRKARGMNGSWLLSKGRSGRKSFESISVRVSGRFLASPLPRQGDRKICIHFNSSGLPSPHEQFKREEGKTNMNLKTSFSFFRSFG